MTEDTRLDPPSLEIAGPRATIRLHRSRHRNRIEPGDIVRILEHLDTVDANRDLRVLVLAASGPAFSAGFHLGGFAEDKEAAARAPGFDAMVDRFEAVRIPTICRLQGGVYGGSTDLALTADFRIGVTGMEMFMPAARLGVHYYPGGLRRYVSRLGLNTAKRLFLTAEKLGAEELLRIGYLTHLVAPQDLDAAVDRLAGTLAAMAPLAVQGMKQALNEIGHGALDVAACNERARICKESADIQEGLAAFREKRTPVFRGA
ncbi:enoyl-CoA hydratase/isomerase family protein [Roseomonas eburnea]|uniref:Enoyl-CoA hydratase/isomerase family protein n=1 Tax=Neoroseomonas eburnea TaxID=1346889 RepID=A0A9X9XFB8_9PROT|nr:enoyl-CoA hydratase/isomerase family protein [Neoroseomonas eburnea]MBR0682404.1 enoyl-CoA hydratase/isomerase family protein [Neoroseomonas eburnea]